MLNSRIISAIIGVVILLLIILLNNMLVINIALFIISLLATYELFSVVINKKPLIIAGYIGVTLIYFSHFLHNQNIIKMLFMIYIVMLFIIMLVNYDKVNYYDISVCLLSVIYTSYLLIHILFIKQIQFGNMIIWYVFIGAWATDTFAYFTGISIGKHKLMEKVSPKKTIEGAIGGIIGCSISFLIYTYFLSVFNNIQINYFNIIILSLICSLAAQIGDLTASCIKRYNNVKDFGHIMPGHGGILDRFDSILFVSPIIYYFSIFIKLIY